MEILPSYHFVHHNVHLDSSDIKLGPPYSISYGMACQTLSKFCCRVLHIYYDSIPFFLSMTQQPPIDQGLHIIAASRSHSDTSQSIGLLCTTVRRTDLYLTTHNTHNRQTSMPLAGFEPTIPASKRRRTHP
jgi:hypothetical protein